MQLKNILSLMKKRTTYPVLALLAFTLTFSSCARNIAYHQLDPSEGNCVESTDSRTCKNSYVQYFSDHTIAIAEFSERGNYFNEKRKSNLLEILQSQSEENGIVAIVFVHGWLHNSKETDTNLIDFKRTIAEIAKKRNEFKLGNRELVGIYVGWRGQSVSIPIAENLTFWERKSVAEDLGRGGLSDFLTELDRIDRQRPNNVLVTIGHSFGGAAVGSAVSKTLVSKLRSSPLRDDTSLSEDSDYCETTVCGLGDGIYLLNPALEANFILPLYESALSISAYPSKQAPVLVSLSSEADLATRYAFPVGQTFGLLATSNQVVIDREYFVDHETGKPVKLDEQFLDSGTLGNFPPYLTHRIDVPTIEASCTGNLTIDDIHLVPCTNYTSGSQCGPKRFPKGLDRLPGGSSIKGRPANFPLYFFRTDKHFMSGHNDIFNPHVIALLTAQLNERIVTSSGPKAGNALYQNSNYFAQQYLEALKFSCSFLAG